jgi:hypothetical protein
VPGICDFLGSLAFLLLLLFKFLFRLLVKLALVIGGALLGRGATGEGESRAEWDESVEYFHWDSR